MNVIVVKLVNMEKTVRVYLVVRIIRDGMEWSQKNLHVFTNIADANAYKLKYANCFNKVNDFIEDSHSKLESIEETPKEGHDYFEAGSIVPYHIYFFSNDINDISIGDYVYCSRIDYSGGREFMVVKNKEQADVFNNHDYYHRIVASTDTLIENEKLT